MKILKKISVGTVNGVRGGLKDITDKTRVLTLVGVTGAYKEKTSENMGVSYGFIGEFRGINMHGEDCLAAVAYLPEPAQGLLKNQIDEMGDSSRVEFGFEIWAIPDETAIRGYTFEVRPLMETKPSNALDELSKRLGVEAKPPQAQLGLEAPKEEAVQSVPAKSHAKKR